MNETESADGLTDNRADEQATGRLMACLTERRTRAALVTSPAPRPTVWRGSTMA